LVGMLESGPRGVIERVQADWVHALRGRDSKVGGYGRRVVGEREKGKGSAVNANATR